MQKKRSIKIISIVLILVLICVSITYVKSGNKEVLATTKEFNSENLQDNEHIHVEVDSSGDKVPVPNGYVGSKAKGENEIDTGYVIYEGTEEVNDSNVEEAQKTRNQYVWIPVLDASTMYGTDANGKKWGKLYSFTTETGEEIDPVTGAKPLNWSESDGVIKISNMMNYIEPDTIKSYDVDFRIKNIELDENSTHEFLVQLEQEFSDMIESVEKYAGFYIGRYETGDLNKEKVVVKKGNVNISNRNWYLSYIKCKDLSNANNNVRTGMIWGCQWDRILKWLIESGNKTKEEVSVDSTSWGNYKNAEFKYINNNGASIEKESGTNVIIPTGSTEYSRSNNIYDLAGNVKEWSMGAVNGQTRMLNGGSYGFNGDQYTASILDKYYPNLSYSDYRLSCNVIYKIKEEVANNFKERKY